jgi:hypothetical protein
MMLQTVTIDEVKHKLEAWRAIKRHPSAKIPQELWVDINHLFANPDYKRATIIKELRLGTNQLIREVQGFTTTQRKPSAKHPQQKQNFVKASLAPLITQPTQLHGITIVNTNGVKLSIGAPTAEQFSTLIKLFME